MQIKVLNKTEWSGREGNQCRSKFHQTVRDLVQKNRDPICNPLCRWRDQWSQCVSHAVRDMASAQERGLIAFSRWAARLMLSLFSCQVVVRQAKAWAGPKPSCWPGASLGAGGASAALPSQEPPSLRYPLVLRGREEEETGRPGSTLKPSLCTQWSQLEERRGEGRRRGVCGARSGWSVCPEC